MRRFVAALALGALVLGQAAPGHARTQASEVGNALAAAGINLVYIPTKLVLATMGLVAGGVVGVLTAGDTRSAYALWVPTATGSWVVTPSNLEGREPLEFFGSDYTDKPSPAARRYGSYEAAYSM
jgi:hypothetical protein